MAIYEKLDEVADSIGFTAMEEAFYETKSQEAMGQLVQVAKETQTALKTNAQDSTLLESLYLEFNSTNELLNSADFQLANAIDLEDSVRIQMARDSLSQNLVELESAIGALTEQMDVEKKQQLDDVKMQNAQITTSEIFDENQRIVNDIQLSTVARNNFTLTEGQRDTLYGIAIQCPLSGGVAVYGARFLYELLVEPLFVDDDLNCEAYIFQPRMTALTDEVFVSVSPNPASNFLLISFDKPIESDCRLVLTNQLGGSVLESRIPGNLSSAFVLITDVRTGIYGIQILDNQGQPLYLDKIVIIK